eukprot:1159662-Pelagomonas_calceolata.AAC.5
MSILSEPAGGKQGAPDPDHPRSPPHVPACAAAPHLQATPRGAASRHARADRGGVRGGYQQATPPHRECGAEHAVPGKLGQQFVVADLSRQHPLVVSVMLSVHLDYTLDTACGSNYNPVCGGSQQAAPLQCHPNHALFFEPLRGVCGGSEQAAPPPRECHAKHALIWKLDQQLVVDLSRQHPLNC